MPDGTYFVVKHIVEWFYITILKVSEYPKSLFVGSQILTRKLSWELCCKIFQFIYLSMKLATTCQGLDGYLSVIGNCVIQFVALKMFVAS